MHEPGVGISPGKLMGSHLRSIGMNRILEGPSLDHVTEFYGNTIGINEVDDDMRNNRLINIQCTSHGVHWSDDGISHDKPVGVHLGRIGVNET